MCHRITPLLLGETEELLQTRRATGQARLNLTSEVVEDAYPGKPLAAIVPNDEGELGATELVWGFEPPEGVRSRLVFNTRLDTALRHVARGGMWAQGITSGRCLVPVRAFFESWTRNPPSKGAQVCFTYPPYAAFLLAGVQQDGRLSIVTTEPNGIVSPLHSRMPLVLGPGESSVWLGPDFARLADRSGVRLEAEPLA